MTMEYIYNNMTRSELGDAMEYTWLYALNEAERGLGIFKKWKKFTDWVFHGSNNGSVKEQMENFKRNIDKAGRK